MEDYTEILEWLASYKFLSVSQMLKLASYHWYQISKKQMYHYLRFLRGAWKHLIEKTSFAYHPKYGRVEDIYYLTRKGARYLWEKEILKTEQIKVPRGRVNFYRDYNHRKKIIDIQIAFESRIKLNGGKVLDYRQYFDSQKSRSGQRKSPATKIQLSNSYIIPDSILLAKGTTGQLFLAAIELHQGQRVQKILDQIYRYKKVLSWGELSDQYNEYEKSLALLILIIFEYESTLKTVMQRLNKDATFKYFRSCYRFKSYVEVVKQPLKNRKRLKKLED